MEHIYWQIPGYFNFHDVYDRAVHLAEDGAHFVEVGSWRGRSASYMAVAIANSGKDIQFDCVDTFPDDLYEEFLDNMKPLRREVDMFIHRGESVDVACLYPEGSLDFVFIDASHEAEDVAADIAAWKPKLKPNGILAGDDLQWESVQNGLRMAGLTEVVRSHSVYPSWVITPTSLMHSYWTRGAENDSPELRQQKAATA